MQSAEPLHKSENFFNFGLPPYSPHFSALFYENLKSIDQKLASVERFKVDNSRNTLLRKYTSKVSDLRYD